MQQLCGVAAKLKKSIYILGGASGVAALAAERLKEANPGLIVAGARDGFFRQEDAQAIIEGVNSSGAELLFIGLGSPKQELWIAEHRNNLRVKICQCVGGSIDVMAGRVKRAPLRFQKLKLEWFYRLCAEPSRIARQKRLPLFVMALAKEFVLMTFQRRSAL
jgi:N-acetylglucosaminyldiphosphoundecaprenol N-acetyl-beta-D-mannosaminyltransferase